MDLSLCLSIWAVNNFTHLPWCLTEFILEIILEYLSFIRWDHDKKASTSFSWISFLEFKVHYIIVYGFHTINYWKKIKSKINCRGLYLNKILSMSSDSKASNVGSSMALMLIHKMSSIFVQDRHRLDSHEVSFFCSFSTYEVLCLVVPLIIAFN